MSPLTHGLNYRSTCDLLYLWILLWLSITFTIFNFCPIMLAKSTCFRPEHSNSWKILPPNSACSINILMSNLSFWSTGTSYNTPIPSSAPVERLLSFGSLIHTAKRNRLSDKMFETLLMLKANANLTAWWTQMWLMLVTTCFVLYWRLASIIGHFLHRLGYCLILLLKQHGTDISTFCRIDIIRTIEHLGPTFACVHLNIYTFYFSIHLTNYQVM